MKVNWLKYSRSHFKEKSKKKNLFFFFPESDWISAISSSFSQEMICLFLQCLRYLQKQLKVLFPHLESLVLWLPPFSTTEANSLAFCPTPSVSLQYWRTTTSGSYGCCPRTRPSCPTSGILMGPSHSTAIQDTPKDRATWREECCKEGLPISRSPEPSGHHQVSVSGLQLQREKTKS